ncbi:MAG TPA: radical SAM protein [Acidisphaera sp.]|nr:radical SAM protein [Acidisphaera sp.]
MRVLFSNPPWWTDTALGTDGRGNRIQLFGAGVRAGSRWPFTQYIPSPPDRFMFGSYLPYPFFLGYATTYTARNTGAEVIFRDSIALRESYASYWAFLKQGQFDYVVIESASPSWDHDADLIRRINSMLPSCRIVVAGPIASQGEKMLRELPVHACIRGEYEKGVVKVLNGASGMIDFDLLTLEEMNAAPFPYYDRTYAHRYWDGNPRGMQPPHAQVWSSRGCPYKCIFCVWPATMTGNDPDGTQKRSVRHYKPEYMEAFLTHLVGTYGYRTIYFDDDTFNLGDKHVERMCAIMRKIGLPWSAMCRADTIRMDLWREMKESGCFGVKIGFESGNQEVVDTIVNKRLDLEYARQVVAEIKRIGMTVHGTFTYGLPGETVSQMFDTRRYIASLGLDTLRESGCAEIEGTPLHTLSSVRSLPKFPGAKVDDDYVRERDGRVKFDRIASVLNAGD